MRWQLSFVAPAVVSLMIIASGCGGTSAETEESTLDIRGSDTMVNLGAALAEAYMDANPDVNLVVQGGGSGTGIAAVLNHNADLAQSSRKMSDEEWADAQRDGIDIQEVVVAYDAVAVVVHPDNPVEELTLQQIGSIYRGEFTNWEEVGGDVEEIVLLSRDTTSGTFVFFRETVLRQDGEHPGAEYADEAMFQPSTQAIVDELSRNRKAIGYIGLGYLGSEVKEIALVVDGEPQRPTEGGENYPLKRPLYFYVVGEKLEGLVSDYLDFVLSEEGQQIVENLDFLPVSE